MSNSYIENFKSQVDFPKPFQRTGKFPLDRTDLFSSYEDAVKYAKGDRNDPDSRGLCGTSYVGQIITVYENDKVTVYKIEADRTISEIGAPSATVKFVYEVLNVGDVTKDITIPTGCTFNTIIVTDSTTGEVVLTDISHYSNVINVSLAESYTNPLDITVSYIV